MTDNGNLEFTAGQMALIERAVDRAVEKYSSQIIAKIRMAIQMHELTCKTGQVIKNAKAWVMGALAMGLFLGYASFKPLAELLSKLKP